MGGHYFVKNESNNCGSNKPLCNSCVWTIIFEVFDEENATMLKFSTVFQKSCKVFCAKPKEVNPVKLRFSITNKVFRWHRNI